jgi:hypothetical protein
MPGEADRRASPRVALELTCSLARRSGSVVTGHTVDVGPGGMCVTTARPLTPDELLDFELPDREGRFLRGRARVLREQTYHVYALRFERLADGAREWLDELAG